MVSFKRRQTLLDFEKSIDNQSYAPRRKTWKLKADSIIEILNSHESFEVMEGYNFNNLPSFTDLTLYNLTKEAQFELWSLETRRLVDVVNAARPLELEGQRDWFGIANREGYHRLGKLANQLHDAMSICYQDNELILLEHAPFSSNPTRFKTAKQDLLKKYGPDATEHLAKFSLRLDSENDKCYQTIINYITGTLAQILVRVVEGDFWDNNCIATLAKLATKLKIVGLDIQDSAAISIAAEKQFRSRLRRAGKDDFPLPPEKENTTTGIQLEAMKRDVKHQANNYFGVMSKFHQLIGVLLLSTIRELGFDPHETTYPDVFESSAIMYDTGFRGQRSMLFQERAGAIGASGNRVEAHCADFVFEVCLEAFENLKENLRARPRAPLKGTGDDISTLVSWKWTKLPHIDKMPNKPKKNVEGVNTNNTMRIRDTMSGFLPSDAPRIMKISGDGEPWGPGKGLDVRKDHMSLVWMQDAITALVPQSMVGGAFCGALAEMIHTLFASADPIHAMKMCREVRFLAAFTMRSGAHQMTLGQDVTLVSASAIAKERALAITLGTLDQPTLTNSSQISPLDIELLRQLQKAKEYITKGLDTMEQWTIDEKAIIVPSRAYCYGSLLMCAALIIGGLAIGFSVEQRISGVDPFNISIFCWTFAAFIIIVLKSIRVENWPWRDFFHGRVVCRSVSEVCSVSGMEPQLLLSILLRLEPAMILYKRGPFDTIFTRRADDGFSIDVAMTTKTMIQGGCFFIKVQSATGPALMCIRASLHQIHSQVTPQGVSEKGEEVKCRRMEEEALWTDEKNLYTLSTNYLAWHRVLGLFCKDVYFN
ncbi:hypothetical protein F4819DRAFT_473516 [Hypoxylon fuscum]|nr:hypothetical protein F4819DRAFT_473516 [Hypoxylon fuscum]